MKSVYGLHQIQILQQHLTNITTTFDFIFKHFLNDEGIFLIADGNQSSSSFVIKILTF